MQDKGSQILLYITNKGNKTRHQIFTVKIALHHIDAKSFQPLEKDENWFVATQRAQNTTFVEFSTELYASEFFRIPVSESCGPLCVSGTETFSQFQKHSNTTQQIVDTRNHNFHSKRKGKNPWV